MFAVSALLFAVCTIRVLADQSQWPTVTFRTNTYVMPQLQYNKTGETANGYLFFAPIEGGVDTAPIIMTDKAEPVWIGNSSHTIKIGDFNTQQLDGQSVLTYWAGTHQDSDFGHGYGWFTILNEAYEVAYNICIGIDQLNIVTPTPQNFPGNQQNACYMDSHEHYITPQNTLISSAWNVTQRDLSELGGPNPGWLYDYIFFEIDISTSKILYQWSALDHVPLNTSKRLNPNSKDQLNFNGEIYGTAQAQSWEWFHMNSISPMPDGYLVSSRLTTSIYYVNKTSGDVIWTLEGSQGGDFTLDPDVFFSFQHMSRLESTSADGSVFGISLFNNDNVGFDKAQDHNVSSGLLLSVDTNAMHVSLAQKFIDTVYGVQSYAGGSYHNASGDHVLLGYGKSPVLEEFDGAGNLVWSGQFGPLKNGDASYRAFKQPWASTPPYLPIVFSGDNNTLYMSWNGATEYDNWNIYGCTGNGTGCSKQGNIPRQGFESNYMLTGSPAWVIVEALNTSTALRNSSALKVGGGLSASPTSYNSSGTIISSTSTAASSVTSTGAAISRRDASFGLAMAAVGAVILLG